MAPSAFLDTLKGLRLLLYRPGSEWCVVVLAAAVARVAVAGCGGSAVALRWLPHRKLTHPVWLPAAHLACLRGSDASHIVFWGDRVTEGCTVCGSLSAIPLS